MKKDTKEHIEGYMTIDKISNGFILRMDFVKEKGLSMRSDKFYFETPEDLMDAVLNILDNYEWRN